MHIFRVRNCGNNAGNNFTVRGTVEMLVPGSKQFVGGEGYLSFHAVSMAVPPMPTGTLTHAPRQPGQMLMQTLSCTAAADINRNAGV